MTNDRRSDRLPAATIQMRTDGRLDETNALRTVFYLRHGKPSGGRLGAVSADGDGKVEAGTGNNLNTLEVSAVLNIDVTDPATADQTNS